MKIEIGGNGIVYVIAENPKELEIKLRQANIISCNTEYYELIFAMLFDINSKTCRLGFSPLEKAIMLIPQDIITGNPIYNDAYNIALCDEKEDPPRNVIRGVLEKIKLHDLRMMAKYIAPIGASIDDCSDYLEHLQERFEKQLMET